MSVRPAVLGGQAIFAQPVPIVRPVLPSFVDIEQEVREILSTRRVTKGPNAAKFEQAVSSRLGVDHAIAVSSCTSGLMLAIRALGISGEVIVPSFTFMATVAALVWAGVQPVFADVDGQTGNLDPSAVEALITPKTTAIMTVHNFGAPAEIRALQRLADRYNLKLIFDAAHGFGALYQGAPVGSQGDLQVFSLSPTKLVVAAEGGIVATNDAQLAERIRIGREYGNSGSYDSLFAGLSARMPEFNAVLGLHSLEELESAAAHRNEIAALYRESLGSLPGFSCQVVAEGNRSAYKDFFLLVDFAKCGLTRDALATALRYENVETRTYYSPAVHQQTAYAQFVRQEAPLANTERLAACGLCLPIWSDMEGSVASDIVLAIRRICDAAGEVQRATTLGG